MKLKVNWKELMKQLWAAVRPVLLGAIGGGSVTIEGSGLAGAAECTFTCQDKAGEKHDTVFGAGDFTASADGTRIEVSDDMLVGHMRNACSAGMSELDTEKPTQRSR